MTRIALALATVWAAVPAAAEEPLREDFESGFDRWERLDPETWKLVDGPTGRAIAITARKSAYTPPHRSPGHVALLKDVQAGDFTLTFRARSTGPDVPHRDVCVFFGFQDPANFYYVHLGAVPDPHSGQIMVVDDAPRRAITENTNKVPWSDRWHTVRLTRTLSTGEIAIYFDDFDTPIMTATDTTFGPGRIGLGSFDDTALFDDVELELR